MNTKKLAVTNGVVGLGGGIALLLGGWIVLYSSTGGAEAFAFVNVLFLVLKIATLVLGIVGLVQFSKEAIISKSPSVLLVVAGALSLIPFMGWIGGILAIIGGSIYLANIKKFK